jgi:hypothetical protein
MNSSGSGSGKTRETGDATGLNYDMLSDFALGKLGFTLSKARLVPEDLRELKVKITQNVESKAPPLIFPKQPFEPAQEA